MASFGSNIRQLLKRNKFVAYGLPFLVLLVGGSFALREFAQLRYTFRKGKLLTFEEAEQMGIKMKRKDDAPTLEREYEKLKKLDLDHWENIRGPRPWEDSKTVQQTLREKAS